MFGSPQDCGAQVAAGAGCLSHMQSLGICLSSGFIMLNSLLQRRQRKGVRFSCNVHWKDVDSELCSSNREGRRRTFLIASWDTWSYLKGGNCLCQEVDDHVVEVSGGCCGFSGSFCVCFCCFLKPSPASQLNRQPLEVLILTSAPAAEQSAEECV